MTERELTNPEILRAAAAKVAPLLSELQAWAAGRQGGAAPIYKPTARMLVQYVRALESDLLTAETEAEELKRLAADDRVSNELIGIRVRNTLRAADEAFGPIIHGSQSR